MTDDDFIPVRAERMMRSDAARKNRHELKEVLNIRKRKEREESIHLLDKHNNLLKAKKRKQKKEMMYETK